MVVWESTTCGSRRDNAHHHRIEYLFADKYLFSILPNQQRARSDFRSIFVHGQLWLCGKVHHAEVKEIYNSARMEDSGSKCSMCQESMYAASTDSSPQAQNEESQWDALPWLWCSLSLRMHRVISFAARDAVLDATEMWTSCETTMRPLKMFVVARGHAVGILGAAGPIAPGNLSALLLPTRERAHEKIAEAGGKRGANAHLQRSGVGHPHPIA
jgi:hypothetical protein